MNYRTNNKNGDELSILGFGCMRFPRNEKDTEKLLLYAIEKGVNFFDTAYIYPNSEATLGRILNKHNKRKDVKIATKLRPSMVKKYSDMDRMFNKQLARLQTDYIDYYFIHMLADETMWKSMLDIGMDKWIEEKKANGKIKNIGFSYHGGKEDFLKLCDVYDWEFTMIQYNYLDEFNQAGKSGLLYAASKGIPVIIMEPLRGGMLANKLPKGVEEVFEQAHEKRTPAEWSFRWIWNHAEATCVLSGMNSMEMLDENIKTASTANAGDFTADDYEVIANVKKAFVQIAQIPCTACNYCMPCPHGVDIPTCLTSYNNISIESKFSSLMGYIQHTSFRAEPQIASNCSQCGKCEPNCPQEIDIRKELKKTAKTFEKFYFKPFLFILKRVFKM
jgi:predicted aldo/keto reductase-like oxidoreductase